jgi:excinuclease ABC subunit A
MTDRVIALGGGARVRILAPVIRGRKGEFRKELREFAGKGFVRARIDGELRELDEEISLARQTAHQVDIVVDRLVAKESTRGRIAESIETAARLADGLVILDVESESEEWTLSEHQACIDCGISYPEISPRLFSFNSPQGACDRCAGLGTYDEFAPSRIIPDESLSIADGAIAPWAGRGSSRYYRRLIEALVAHFEIAPDLPWRELPNDVKRGILSGTGDAEIPFEFEQGRRRHSVRRRWDGVIGELQRRRTDGSEAEREKLARFCAPQPCKACGGSRLRIEARSFRIGGLSISELCGLSIGEQSRFVQELRLTGAEQTIGERILAEISDRLRFLVDVGLSYITLDRSSATLSGGESQRIRLATQVGSRLMGVLYILDEPSVGLHPRDNQKLLSTLGQLRDGGNSVLVVEHDEATIRAADFVIDMGPGAGIHGGRIVARGTPDQILAHEDSITGAYLSGRRSIRVPAQRRTSDGRELVFENCREHNLKHLSVRIPLGLFTVVTGVSGSGKSTLVNETIYRALAARLHGAETPPGRFDRILGLSEIDKVIEVSQAAIGRSPRSNPATYTGVFDGIRSLFSRVPEARVRGYGPGRFSFNVKGGRCEACRGDGTLRIEMHFLPDLFVTCEECAGRRYNRETLEIRYKGHHIADVLEMTVEEALAFAHNVPAVRRPLQTLCDVGLGYLQVGQSSTTLSGGEAQRVKLAKELSRRATGRTLFLLDEPTTGLHFADVEQLLLVLDRLVEKGNTVVVIEHHPDVIKTADHVIDLGPEGGAGGGEIVIAGTPEEVAAHPTSYTGRALAPALKPV